MVDDGRSEKNTEKDEDSSNSGSFHGRLPPPPDFEYSRPSLGRSTPEQSSAGTSGSGQSGSDQPALQSAGRTVAAGMTLAGSLLGGVTVGMWLDSRFGKPGSYLWSALLTAVGAIGGFTNLMRVMNSGGKDRGSK